MVDVPCLDHLWGGQKDYLDVGQVRCFHEETSRRTTFLKGDTRRVTEFQSKRALSNPNPNGQKTSQRTLIQPKMGV